MNKHSRFQGHCRFCSVRPEAGTVPELLTAITAHEKDKHPEKVKEEADRAANTRTGPVKMEDFYE